METYASPSWPIQLPQAKTGKRGRDVQSYRLSWLLLASPVATKGQACRVRPIHQLPLSKQPPESAFQPTCHGMTSPPSFSIPNSKAYPHNYTMSTVRLALD